MLFKKWKNTYLQKVLLSNCFKEIGENIKNAVLLLQFCKNFFTKNVFFVCTNIQIS